MKLRSLQSRINSNRSRNFKRKQQISTPQDFSLESNIMQDDYKKNSKKIRRNLVQEDIKLANEGKISSAPYNSNTYLMDINEKPTTDFQVNYGTMQGLIDQKFREMMKQIIER